MVYNSPLDGIKLCTIGTFEELFEDCYRARSAAWIPGVSLGE